MISFGICEQGAVRKENQDAILMCREGGSGLFIVADGVGGSQDGGAASRLITGSFQHWWDEVLLPNRQLSFPEVFAQAKARTERLNEELYRLHGSGQCCSTIALLLIHRRIYGFLSAGDSRIYHCGARGLRLLTRDDTWENRPDGNRHPGFSGRILSAVGGYRALEYSCATARLGFRDCFFLCSDGFYRFADKDLMEKQLCAVRQKLFPDPTPLRLLAEGVVEKQTDDNYSAILVKV